MSERQPALNGRTGRGARVRVRDLGKVYRTRRGEVPALRSVSLDVYDGEILVLLGPSGCGKTTLLRCVAGLEHPDRGEIEVGGRVVFSKQRSIWIPPERRQLSMVFQSYALWPHMTVLHNVMYPLENMNLSRTEIRERALEVLRLMRLDGYAAAHPGQLSGGQQQRVALARALVGNSQVVLFDEPLSNLDAQVRERLRLELLALHRAVGFSALYVTHDQVEAAVLGNRIAVMDRGVVAQLGSPADVYLQPASRYVAGFVGSANELRGTIVTREAPYWRVRTPLGEIRGRGATVDLEPGDEVSVMFRPEHCQWAADGNGFRCRVNRVIFLGTCFEYLLQVGDGQLVLRTMTDQQVTEGAERYVWISPERVHVFRD